jgi:hypothetical protein
VPTASIDDGGSRDGGTPDPRDASVPGDGGMVGMDGGGPDDLLDAQVDGATDGATSGDASEPVAVPCTGPGSPSSCACDLWQLRCGLECFDVLTDPTHCGDCSIACATGQVCAAGVCAPRCGTLADCGGICVDLSEDVNHCGLCANVCDPGAACIAGDCVGSAVGHIVLIGHDMSASRPPMRTLVGNAVFLVRSSPVRVLVYDAQTAPESRIGVSDAIRLSAQGLGRAYVETRAVEAEVTLQLSSTDVFVIDVQHGADNAQLQTLGQSWSLALGQFLEQGGVILLFDAGGANDGTYQILGPLGASLLPIDSRQPRPNDQYRLVTPSDAIAAGVPNRYQSEGQSASFTIQPLAMPQPVVVVREPAPLSMEPVVIHLAIERM